MTSAVSAPPAAGLSAPKARVPFWDNARFLLIITVPLGHMLPPIYDETNALMALYVFLYAFHMPAFVLMSGYFARGEALRPVDYRRIFTDMIVPYILIEAVIRIYNLIWYDDPGPLITQASWGTWFMLALAFWRIALPYVTMLRWPVLWALLITLGVGFLHDIDTTLALRRTFGFFVFFVIGWALKEYRIADRLRLAMPKPWWVKGIALVVLATAAFVVWRNLDWLKSIDVYEWYGYNSYANLLGEESWWNPLARLAFVAVALVLTAAVLMLIPTGQYRWTVYGNYTLYVYLLHLVVLWPIREEHVMAGYGNLMLLVVPLCAVVLSLILVSKPVRFLTKWFIEPGSWMERIGLFRR